MIYFWNATRKRGVFFSRLCNDIFKDLEDDYMLMIPSNGSKNYFQRTFQKISLKTLMQRVHLQEQLSKWSPEVSKKKNKERWRDWQKQWEINCHQGMKWQWWQPALGFATLKKWRWPQCGEMNVYGLTLGGGGGCGDGGATLHGRTCSCHRCWT